ncbi:type II toxin-antitoxin system RelE/ParE family toxin [Flavobacterium sp. RHBU_3]|uniref:type II toxin-antitoxin system RelE/ParE family toxin n=1 Tax=Flavobacterium sp. RHBU_3 TaxID=3391184 RepID=UPI003984BB8B
MAGLRFTDDAVKDVEEAILWYEEQRTGLSFDFELCLEVAVSEIIRNPEAFQSRYKNVKIVFIKRFPFGIHYIETAEMIIVIGVFHTSRSPKSWKKRG